MAHVAEYHGIVSGTAAAEIFEKAKKQNPEAAKRILIKGDAEVSSEDIYFLNAAPLNLSGADGSPCRAVLIAAER